MGYSPQGHTESDMTEAAEHAQIRKPRLREVKKLSEGHKGRKEHNCIWLLFKFYLFI